LVDVTYFYIRIPGKSNCIAGIIFEENKLLKKGIIDRGKYYVFHPGAFSDGSASRGELNCQGDYSLGYSPNDGRSK